MRMNTNLLNLESGSWTLQLHELRSCDEDSGNNFGLDFMNNFVLPRHQKWEDKSLTAQVEAWEHAPTHNKHIWDAKTPWVLGTTTTTTTNSIHTHIFLLSDINTKRNSSDSYWTETTTFSQQPYADMCGLEQKTSTTLNPTKLIHLRNSLSLQLCSTHQNTTQHQNTPIKHPFTRINFHLKNCCAIEKVLHPRS